MKMLIQHAFFFNRITSYTGILQIVNLTQADAGDYVCQTSPRLGQHIDTTLEHSATLTVNTGKYGVKICHVCKFIYDACKRV